MQTSETPWRCGLFPLATQFHWRYLWDTDNQKQIKQPNYAPISQSLVSHCIAFLNVERLAVRLAPLPHPIRSTTETNRDTFTHVFPRRPLNTLASSFYWFNGLSVSHSIEKNDCKSTVQRHFTTTMLLKLPSFNRPFSAQRERLVNHLLIVRVL